MNFMQTNLFENDIEINKDISALIWNKKLNRIEIQKKLELINTKRQKTAAFYTDSELVDNIIQELPSFSKLKKMTILEPSVGVGSFLWEIAKKYKNKKINYILVDINKESLLILKELLKRFPIHNASFEYINTDFLNLDVSNKKIDIVIGNPPFGKINKNLLAQKYISNNLATIFLEKILKIKSYISLVLPKSILNAPNFNQFRRFIKFYNIKSFIDFGESGFKGVKIETINIMIDMKSKDPINNLKIISNIDKTKKFLPKNYVIDDNYPYWLIYRNKFFDSIAKKLIFDQFFVFRDRQLTKKNTKSIMSKNDIWILRSRNFTDDRKIIHIDKYDRFISKQMAKKTTDI